VPRHRVTSLLSAARERRVTLVVAGAGYGKTTALTALSGLSATGLSHWVRVRPSDGQAESFAARIAAALGESPAPERSAIAAATGSDDRKAFAEQRAEMLCDLAGSAETDLLLVIDGVEHLGQDEAAGYLLRVLSLQAPPQLHLVLSGRTMPELGLGGVQGRGELLELTAPDLSFTAAETAELVETRLGAASADVAAECSSLTGGWPAALQLLLDRLERLAPAERQRELSRIRHSRGQLWQAFAEDVLAGEQPSVRRVLAVASLAPRIDADLLAGVAVPAARIDLPSLKERGLLAEAGGHGYYKLSPVLEAVGTAPGRPDEQEALRARVARWLEENGRLEEALECHANADRETARSFFGRRGPALVRSGAAARLIEVLRRHGTGGDRGLDAVLAEALQAVGEWDSAIDLFSRAQPGEPARSAGVAWRYGLLLYLRGQSAAAAAILAAAHEPASSGADDAMVSAWLSTTLWSQGNLDAAEDLARTSLHQAAASGDSCAIAAAHVSVALAAASRGQRERNAQSYRLALAAALEGGDRVQQARIHANLSSRALESGAYAQAITEANLALETGAGHRFFSALALVNKAEAHLCIGQLEEARTAIADAEAIYEALGSLHASVPHVLYGELYRQRGNTVRARSAFERARALAEEADDAHTLVHAMSGLARVLAEEDIDAARAAAGQAVAKAGGLEKASALCASAEVELWARDAVAAQRLALQAEAQARATDDRPALAESLELQGAARVPADPVRLGSAIELWDDIGNPVRAARARLGLAITNDDHQAADLVRHELAAMGVAPALGITAVLAASQRGGHGVAIIALGRFTVLRAGRPVARAEWQSRKARDLLKLLVARRGRAITRELAAELMWPGEDAEPLGNRLSVALSIIRKVLDPQRRHGPDHYVVADARSVALRIDHINIDLITFLRAADEAISLVSDGEKDAAETRLRQARELYVSDFLEEDSYEDWAVDAREEARSRILTILRLLARLAAERNDDEAATRYLGQLLERDPYDEDAWLALIAGQLHLRRHGEARRRYAAYAKRMAELDVAPVALADTTGRRP
jgi:ATP/maltotriose-dependent transcriptional regulator MalT/DNA-binding SARP family transcriptional activator